jgi:hypothetical protein
VYDPAAIPASFFNLGPMRGFAQPAPLPPQSTGQPHNKTTIDYYKSCQPAQAGTSVLYAEPAIRDACSKRPSVELPHLVSEYVLAEDRVDQLFECEASVTIATCKGENQSVTNYGVNRTRVAANYTPFQHDKMVYGESVHPVVRGNAIAGENYIIGPSVHDPNVIHLNPNILLEAMIKLNPNVMELQHNGTFVLRDLGYRLSRLRGAKVMFDCAVRNLQRPQEARMRLCPFAGTEFMQHNMKNPLMSGYAAVVRMGTLNYVKHMRINSTLPISQQIPQSYRFTDAQLDMIGYHGVRYRLKHTAQAPQLNHEMVAHELLTCAYKDTLKDSTAKFGNVKRGGAVPDVAFDEESFAKFVSTLTVKQVDSMRMPRTFDPELIGSTKLKCFLKQQYKSKASGQPVMDGANEYIRADVWKRIAIRVAFAVLFSIFPDSLHVASGDNDVPRTLHTLRSKFKPSLKYQFEADVTAKDTSYGPHSSGGMRALIDYCIEHGLEKSIFAPFSAEMEAMLGSQYYTNAAFGLKGQLIYNMLSGSQLTLPLNGQTTGNDLVMSTCLVVWNSLQEPLEARGLKVHTVIKGVCREGDVYIHYRDYPFGAFAFVGDDSAGECDRLLKQSGYAAYVNKFKLLSCLKGERSLSLCNMSIDVNTGEYVWDMTRNTQKQLIRDYSCVKAKALDEIAAFLVSNKQLYSGLKTSQLPRAAEILARRARFALDGRMEVLTPAIYQRHYDHELLAIQLGYQLTNLSREVYYALMQPYENNNAEVEY